MTDVARPLPDPERSSSAVVVSPASRGSSVSSRRSRTPASTSTPPTSWSAPAPAASSARSSGTVACSRRTTSSTPRSPTTYEEPAPIDAEAVQQHDRRSTRRVRPASRTPALDSARPRQQVDGRADATTSARRPSARRCRRPSGRSKPLAVTAVDATDGTFRVLTAADGVPLPRAVAASCSVPFVWSPVDDRRPPLRRRWRPLRHERRRRRRVRAGARHRLRPRGAVTARPVARRRRRGPPRRRVERRGRRGGQRRRSRPSARTRSRCPRRRRRPRPVAPRAPRSPSRSPPSGPDRVSPARRRAWARMTTPFSDLDQYVALPRVDGIAISPDGTRVALTVSALDPDAHRVPPIGLAGARDADPRHRRAPGPPDTLRRRARAASPSPAPVTCSSSRAGPDADGDRPTRQPSSGCCPRPAARPVRSPAWPGASVASWRPPASRTSSPLTADLLPGGRRRPARPCRSRRRAPEAPEGQAGARDPARDLPGAVLGPRPRPGPDPRPRPSTSPTWPIRHRTATADRRRPTATTTPSYPPIRPVDRHAGARPLARPRAAGRSHPTARS